MLQNWLYRGNVAHKEKIYPGQHAAIIEPELWQAVQDRLTAGRRERSMAVGAEAPSLLSGLIFDSDGARLSQAEAEKRGCHKWAFRPPDGAELHKRSAEASGFDRHARLGRTGHCERA